MEKLNSKYIIKCPVCGEDVEVFDICDNCGWENSGPINIDGGANEKPLAEYKKEYEKKAQLAK